MPSKAVGCAIELWSPILNRERRNLKLPENKSKEQARAKQIAKTFINTDLDWLLALHIWEWSFDVENLTRLCERDMVSITSRMKLTPKIGDRSWELLTKVFMCCLFAYLPLVSSRQNAWNREWKIYLDTCSTLVFLVVWEYVEHELRKWWEC